MKRDNQTMKDIGTACRNIRLERGLTQQQVGDAVGYSRSNVAMFECGLTNNALLLNYYLDLKKEMTENGAQDD